MIRRLASRALITAALLLAAAHADAADPGTPYPTGSALSDDKSGSVLIYNLYSSSASTPDSHNTAVSITNQHETAAATVRLFFVDGATGAALTGAPISLAPNQAVTLIASDLVPGLRGYAVAVAIDAATGCPTSFNALGGSAAVKLGNGQQADLAAVAVSALYTGTIAGCDAMAATATLDFDDVVYNRLPATVAVDSYASPDDGNSGLLVLNRIGGDLTTGAATLGLFSYEAIATNGGTGSGSINIPAPQLQTSTATFLSPPAGHTAWLRVSGAADKGYSGAFLNFNPNASASAGAFTGGHNLHTLTLADESLVVPVLSAANDPGTPYPDASAASDNRAGSVLVYSLIASSSGMPTTQNASLTITNTHDAEILVRVFFVDGTSGAVTQQTATLPPFGLVTALASDLVPDLRGYVIVVASDADSGCPIAYNHLIGDIDVKLSTGHFASLPATAVAALYDGTLSGCPGDMTALHFDGAEYTLLPYVLALDSFGSVLDGNDTRLVLDHAGGDLDTSLTPLGTVNGSLFDDAGSEYPFTFNAPAQQFAQLNNSFPPLGGPTLDAVVPAGRTGWLKAYPATAAAMVGSVLSFNPNAAASTAAFNGGHNLHVLTLTADELAVSEFPPDTPTPTPTATETGTATSTPTATLIPAGGACTVASECATGFCVETICCNDACDGPNESCDQRGFEGTCRPLPAAAPALSPSAAVLALAALIAVGLVALRLRRRSL